MAGLKRILAGTDFSRQASHAVERAAALAAEHSARLEIVHVSPRIDESSLRALGLRGKTRRDPCPEVSRCLEQALSLARSRCPKASVKRLTGGAGAMLSREAERFGAGLVVVGGRGERTVRDAVIGTTAERVSERCRSHVLVVREKPEPAYSNVLACVALGPASISVLEAALALSDRAAVHVLHAFEPPFEMKLLSFGIPASAVENHREAAKREAKAALLDLLGRWRVPPGRSFETALRRGRPYQAILTEAKRVKADVVVLGKNQSALEEFFLGGVTKQVMRAASWDVVIAHHPRGGSAPVP